jgi:cell division protein FtsI (penicillin-binding protein 3)
MTTFSPTRAAVVLSVIVTLFCALIGRVAWLETYGRQQTIRRADRQQHQNQVLPARRGSIYDRNWILMAGTTQTRTLYVDPKFMQDSFQEDGKSLGDMDKAVDQLAKILKQNPNDLSELLGDRAESRYVKIAQNLDDATVDKITALNLPGIGVTPTDGRAYPMNAVASHILGGVGKDGRGLEGLELEFEKQLAGSDGFERVLKDARRRPIGVSSEDYVAARHGKQLWTTIDANIQTILEEELNDTCTHFDAKRGEAVVIDPHTGEILGLANWPTFNLNDAAKTDPKIRRNRAITDPYEPGSTIKPFIVGPALAWHVTHESDMFHLGGLHYRTPYGRMITDVHGYDDLCLWDVLVKSSNIGMSQLGERLGNPRLHTALASWDFGRPTGIELPGENGGKLNRLAKWSHFSTESVSQGYEIMVTPVQLARAFCGYANGGKLVTPHLVKGLVDADGTVEPVGDHTAFEDLPQVVSPEAAADVRRILVDVPIRGTAEGSGTRSLTWNIFGKTGTAHISEGKAGYSTTKFNSSFIAGAPAENPRLVIAFIIHEPDKSKGHYGGNVAGPGASRVLQRSLEYLQVPPSPDVPLPPADVIPVLHAFNPKAYDRTVKAVAIAKD